MTDLNQVGGKEVSERTQVSDCSNLRGEGLLRLEVWTL